MPGRDDDDEAEEEGWEPMQTAGELKHSRRDHDHDPGAEKRDDEDIDLAHPERNE